MRDFYCAERTMSFWDDVTVRFDEVSTIQFYDKDDVELFQLQPADLSVLYGAYQQMLKEERERKREEK